MVAIHRVLGRFRLPLPFNSFAHISPEGVNVSRRYVLDALLPEEVLQESDHRPVAFPAPLIGQDIFFIEDVRQVLQLEPVVVSGTVRLRPLSFGLLSENCASPIGSGSTTFRPVVV
jgi:hypothetical protein